MFYEFICDSNVEGILSGIIGVIVCWVFNCCNFFWKLIFGSGVRFCCVEKLLLIFFKMKFIIIFIIIIMYYWIILGSLFLRSIFKGMVKVVVWLFKLDMRVGLFDMD